MKVYILLVYGLQKNRFGNTLTGGGIFTRKKFDIKRMKKDINEPIKDRLN